MFDSLIDFENLTSGGNFFLRSLSCERRIQLLKFGLGTYRIFLLTVTELLLLYKSVHYFLFDSLSGIFITKVIES